MADAESKSLLEEKEIDVGNPLDLTFKKLKSLEEVVFDAPGATRVGTPERGVETRRYLTRSIWLNNNKLTSIKFVGKFVQSVLEKPEKLGWIDFSFNYITGISEDILQCPNLKILYFHGNSIKNMEEIVCLRKLKGLKNITFHGNPMTNTKFYRRYVITVIPQIENVDFSPVTNLERHLPKPPEAVKQIKIANDKEKKK